MIKIFFSIVDKVFNQLSLKLFDPFLIGKVKDSLAKLYLLISKKKYQEKINKTSKDKYIIEIDNYQNFLKNNVINLNCLNISNLFLPYIEKYKSINYEEPKKSYFYNILRNDIDNYFYNLFLEIGIHNNLVEILKKNFGELIFCGGGIYRSPPLINEIIVGSQKWHLDRFSLKHFKLFINLSDVDKSMGPTEILTSGTTSKLLKNSFYRKITNKNNLPNIKGGLHINKKDFMKSYSNSKFDNIGPPGNALLANTGLCLHRGSLNYSNQDRFILLFHYCIWDRYVENQKDDITLGIKTRFLV